MALSSNEKKALSGMFTGEQVSGGSDVKFQNLSKHEQTAMSGLFPNAYKPVSNTSTPTVQPKPQNNPLGSVGSFFQNAGNQVMKFGQQTIQGFQQPQIPKATVPQNTKLPNGTTIQFATPKQPTQSAQLAKPQVTKPGPQGPDLVKQALLKAQAFGKGAENVIDAVFKIPDKAITATQNVIYNASLKTMNGKGNILDDQIVKQAQQMAAYQLTSEAIGGIAQNTKAGTVGSGAASFLRGVQHGVIQQYLGDSRKVMATFNTKLDKPVKFGDQVSHTVGDVVGGVMAFIAGGEVLKGLGLGKAALPVLFTVLGQTSSPYTTTAIQRIEKAPVDALTGWLFSKVPVPTKLLSTETLRSTIAATDIGMGSAFVNSIIAGMSPKEASKTAATMGVIAGLFHIAGTATGLFTNKIIESKYRQGELELTPEQVREQVKNTNLKDTKAGQHLYDLSVEAEAQGKNIKITGNAAQQSTVAKLLKLETPSGVTVNAELVDANPQLANNEYTPREARSAVVGSDLQDTPEGRAIMKASIDAEQQGKNISFSHPIQEANIARESITMPDKYTGVGEEDNFTALKNDPTGMRDKYIQKYNNVVSTDLANNLFPNYKGHNVNDTQRPAGQLRKLVYDHLLNTKQGEGNNTVLITSGGSGAGKTSAISKMLPDKQLGDYPIILDTTLASRAADRDVQKVLSKGFKVHIAYVLRDPVEAWKNGVLPRTQTEGRVVGEGYHEVIFERARKAILKVYDKFKDNPNVDFRFIDNTGGPGEAKLTDVERVRNFEYNANTLREAIQNATEQSRKSGQLTEEQYKSATADRSRLGSESGGQSEQSNKAKTEESLNSVRESLFSGDDQKALDTYNQLAKTAKNIPTLEDLQNEVNKAQLQQLNEVRHDLEQMRTGGIDDPTNQLLVIADKMKRHFAAPRAKFKLTGKERVYTMEKTGESMLVGGTAAEAFDRLVYATDLSGFSKQVRILADKFDTVFTEIDNSIQKGDIDGADYEKFKARFAETKKTQGFQNKKSKISGADKSARRGNVDEKQLKQESKNTGSSNANDGNGEITSESDSTLRTELQLNDRKLNTVTGEERSAAVAKSNAVRNELNKRWETGKETIFQVKQKGKALDHANIEVYKYDDGKYAVRYETDINNSGTMTPFYGAFDTKAAAVEDAKKSIQNFIDINKDRSDVPVSGKQLLKVIQEELNNLREKSGNSAGNNSVKNKKASESSTQTYTGGVSANDPIIQKLKKYAEGFDNKEDFLLSINARIPASILTGDPEPRGGAVYQKAFEILNEKGYKSLDDFYEREVRATPGYKGAKAGANIGDFSDLRNLSEDAGFFKAMEFPEIVRLVKDLTGKYPEVWKRLGQQLGDAQEGSLRVRMNAEGFKNTLTAAKVLAHELGHIVDYLPQGTATHGNLLAKIANINGYLKTLLKEFPESIDNALTPKERDQLRKQAREQSKQGVVVTEQVATGFRKVNPDEILAIWNDSKAGFDTPELLSYIQGLTASQKKDIVINAMRGKVAEWVNYQHPTYETVTHEVFKKAPNDIRELYRKLLREEILKRRLHELSKIRKELKDLSQKWRPWNRETSDVNYRKYRDSSHELYADAVSVLFNDPERLKLEAPHFWKAFFNYIDQKPDVAKTFFDTWNLLNQGQDTVLSERRRIINEGFATGEQKWQAMRQEQKDRKRNFFFEFKYDFIDRNQKLIDFVKEAKKRGDFVRDDQNPEYLLNGRNYLAGRVKYFLSNKMNRVYQHLLKNNLTLENWGEMLLYERIVNAPERQEIANPYGLDKKTARETMNKMKQDLGEEKFAALQKGVKMFRNGVRPYLKEAYDAGMYSSEMYQQMISNPAYATFAVIDYLDNYISAHIYHSVGTLKEVANPATATVMKMISTIRGIEHQKVKVGTFDFLKQHFPDELKPAKKSWNGRAQIPVESEDPNLKLVKYLHEGKVEGYYVDKYIASSLNYETPDRVNIALQIFRALNGGFLKPLFTTFNVGFQTFNLVRDAKRFVKNYPDRSILRSTYVLGKGYLKALPPAAARAFGIENDTISRMEEDKVLGITYNDLLKGQTSEDKQLDYLMQKYDVMTRNSKRPIYLRPFIAFLDAIENVGNMIETLPKVAGYQALEAKMPKNEMADFVRSYLGSPDFLKGGASKWWTNEVFLFSNAITQGIRADYTIATQPKTRTGYWWKTIMIDILPKVLMLAAALGLMGEELKRRFGDVSEYDKTNYLIVPFGSENNKTTYLRIPQDDTGRFLSGLVWKAMSAATGRASSNVEDSIFQLLSYAGGQFPSLTPLLQSTVATAQYAAGQNPYDFYRGRQVVPQQQFDAGGQYRAKPFFTWLIQSLGANIVLGTSVTEQTGGKKGPLQSLLELPIASNVLGRWIKISNYGQTEQNSTVQKQIKSDNAVAAIQHNQNLDRALEAWKNSDHTPETRAMLGRQLVKESFGTVTKDNKTLAQNLVKKFKLSIVKGYNDPNINAVIDANTNKERLLIMRRMKSQSTHADYVKFRNSLIQNKVVSKELLKSMVHSGL